MSVKNRAEHTIANDINIPLTMTVTITITRTVTITMINHHYNNTNINSYTMGMRMSTISTETKNTTQATIYTSTQARPVRQNKQRLVDKTFHLISPRDSEESHLGRAGDFLRKNLQNRSHENTLDSKHSHLHGAS